jgi:hypothetical protein
MYPWISSCEHLYNNGMNLLLYLCIQWEIKLAVVIDEYHCTYTNISNILFSYLNQFIDEIIVDNQGGFRYNRLTTARYSAFLIYNIEKSKYSGTVYTLLIHFKKVRDPVRGEVLYSYNTLGECIRKYP